VVDAGVEGPWARECRVDDPWRESDFVAEGGELCLSNLGQLELLRGLTERGARLRTTVRGASMAPFIRDRDVLTIAPLGGRDPRPGEVVAFTLPGSGRLAVHRVVARDGAGWLIRGDNCPKADGVVARDEMIGRVVRVERAGRDVRLGLGPERVCVAALSRADALTKARALGRLPRRAAGSLLTCAQGFAAYREVAGRLTPRIVVAESSEADLDAVRRRLDPASASRRRAPDPNVTEWVARRGAKVIGCVQLVYHPESHAPWLGYWLFSLVVWKRYRGLGVGEALTRRVIAGARARGAAELRLSVYDGNAPAIALYRRLGFARVVLPTLEPTLAAEEQEVGRRRIVMSKRLDGGVGM
jgi:ribosomal protein S18 acetylase RimI-like enzyme